MAQQVRVHALQDRRRDPGPAHRLLHRAHREPPTRAVEEERRLSATGQLRAAALEVAGERLARALAEERDALAVALAGDGELAVREVKVPRIDPRQLADAQARGVEQLQQRAVAQPAGRGGVGRCHQLAGLLLGQEARQQPRRLRVTQHQIESPRLAGGSDPSRSSQA